MSAFSVVHEDDVRIKAMALAPSVDLVAMLTTDDILSVIRWVSWQKAFSVPLIQDGQMSTVVDVEYKIHWSKDSKLLSVVGSDHSSHVFSIDEEAGFTLYRPEAQVSSEAVANISFFSEIFSPTPHSQASEPQLDLQLPHLSAIQSRWSACSVPSAPQLYSAPLSFIQKHLLPPPPLPPLVNPCNPITSSAFLTWDSDYLATLVELSTKLRHTTDVAQLQAQILTGEVPASDRPSLAAIAYTESPYASDPSNRSKNSTLTPFASFSSSFVSSTIDEGKELSPSTSELTKNASATLFPFRATKIRVRKALPPSRPSVFWYTGIGDPGTELFNVRTVPNYSVEEELEDQEATTPVWARQVPPDFATTSVYNTASSATRKTAMDLLLLATLQAPVQETPSSGLETEPSQMIPVDQCPVLLLQPLLDGVLPLNRCKLPLSILSTPRSIPNMPAPAQQHLSLHSLTSSPTLRFVAATVFAVPSQTSSLDGADANKSTTTPSPSLNFVLHPLPLLSPLVAPVSTLALNIHSNMCHVAHAWTHVSSNWESLTAQLHKESAALELTIEQALPNPNVYRTLRTTSQWYYPLSPFPMAHAELYRVLQVGGLPGGPVTTWCERQLTPVGLVRLSRSVESACSALETLLLVHIVPSLELLLALFSGIHEMLPAKSTSPLLTLLPSVMETIEQLLVSCQEIRGNVVMARNYYSVMLFWLRCLLQSWTPPTVPEADANKSEATVPAPKNFELMEPDLRSLYAVLTPQSLYPFDRQSVFRKRVRKGQEGGKASGSAEGETSQGQSDRDNPLGLDFSFRFDGNTSTHAEDEKEKSPNVLHKPNQSRMEESESSNISKNGDLQQVTTEISSDSDDFSDSDDGSDDSDEWGYETSSDAAEMDVSYDQQADDLQRTTKPSSLGLAGSPSSGAVSTFEDPLGLGLGGGFFGLDLTPDTLDPLRNESTAGDPFGGMFGSPLPQNGESNSSHNSPSAHVPPEQKNTRVSGNKEEKVVRGRKKRFRRPPTPPQYYNDPFLPFSLTEVLKSHAISKEKWNSLLQFPYTSMLMYAHQCPVPSDMPHPPAPQSSFLDKFYYILEIWKVLLSPQSPVNLFASLPTQDEIQKELDPDSSTSRSVQMPTFDPPIIGYLPISVRLLPPMDSHSRLMDQDKNITCIMNVEAHLQKLVSASACDFIQYKSVPRNTATVLALQQKPLSKFFSLLSLSSQKKETEVMELHTQVFFIPPTLMQSYLVQYFAAGTTANRVEPAHGTLDGNQVFTDPQFMDSSMGGDGEVDEVGEKLEGNGEEEQEPTPYSCEEGLLCILTRPTRPNESTPHNSLSLCSIRIPKGYFVLQTFHLPPSPPSSANTAPLSSTENVIEPPGSLVCILYRSQRLASTPEGDEDENHDDESLSFEDDDSQQSDNSMGHRPAALVVLTIDLDTSVIRQATKSYSLHQFMQSPATLQSHILDIQALLSAHVTTSATASSILPSPVNLPISSHTLPELQVALTKSRPFELTQFRTSHGANAHSTSATGVPTPLGIYFATQILLHEYSLSTDAQDLPQRLSDNEDLSAELSSASTEDYDAPTVKFAAYLHFLASANQRLGSNAFSSQIPILQELKDLDVNRIERLNSEISALMQILGSIEASLGDYRGVLSIVLGKKRAVVLDLMEDEEEDEDEEEIVGDDAMQENQGDLDSPEL